MIAHDRSQLWAYGDAFCYRIPAPLVPTAPTKTRASVVWSQRPQPKHASNPDSVIKKFNPHPLFLFYELFVRLITRGSTKSHSSSIGSLAFDPSDTRIAAGCSDGYVRIYDAHTSQVLAETLVTAYVPPTPPFSSGFAVCAACRALLLVLLRVTKQLLCTATRAILSTLTCVDVPWRMYITRCSTANVAPVLHVSWSRDGQFIAAACADGVLRILDHSANIVGQTGDHVNPITRESSAVNQAPHATRTSYTRARTHTHCLMCSCRVSLQPTSKHAASCINRPANMSELVTCSPTLHGAACGA